MIKIEKGGLLYRLAWYGVDCMEYNISSNICQFIRQVFFGIVKIVFFVFIVSYGLLCLGTPPLQLFMVYLHGDGQWIVHNAAMVIGVAMWVIIILFVLVDVLVSVVLPINKYSIPVKVKNNVLVHYFVAIHNKLCLQITFSGNNDDNLTINRKKE